MRRFRKLIALLLMATLPAYAWAALGLPPMCPMQAAPGVQAEDHACCDSAVADAESSPRSAGHLPCKPGQECKVGALYQAVSPTAEHAPAPAAVVVAAPASPVSSRGPSGVWRPPRVL